MRNIAKRHKIILTELEKDGYVRVQDLSDRLGVSEVTIRKDLKELEKRKMLFPKSWKCKSGEFPY